MMLKRGENFLCEGIALWSGDGLKVDKNGYKCLGMLKGVDNEGEGQGRIFEEGESGGEVKAVQWKYALATVVVRYSAGILDRIDQELRTEGHGCEDEKRG